MFDKLRNFKQKRSKKSHRTNDETTQRNKDYIIDVLSNIDFKASPIPQEKKDYKTNPNQPFGDLEFTAKALPLLIRTTDTFPVDTKKLDTILLSIAEDFGDAVRNGDTRAAFTAKAALVKGVKDYRLRIPSIEGKERAEMYVEKVCEQMTTWRALIAEASRIDQKIKELPELERRTNESLKAEDNDTLFSAEILSMLSAEPEVPSDSRN